MRKRERIAIRRKRRVSPDGYTDSYKPISRKEAEQLLSEFAFHDQEPVINHLLAIMEGYGAWKERDLRLSITKAMKDAN